MLQMGAKGIKIERRRIFHLTEVVITINSVICRLYLNLKPVLGCGLASNDSRE
jgi:hypothetical protein